MTKAGDWILKEFLQLLETLKNVEPWSEVPKALGPSAGETDFATMEYPEIEALPPNALTPEQVTFTGKYDDASWHYGGDFPKDLPIEAGGTHIGMFFAWAVSSGLGGDMHVVDSPDETRATTVPHGQARRLFHECPVTESSLTKT